MLQPLAHPSEGGAHIVPFAGYRIVEHVVRTPRHDARRGECFRWKVFDVESDDCIAITNDGGGEDMTVFGFRQIERRGTIFVARHHAIGNRIVHEVARPLE